MLPKTTLYETVALLTGTGSSNPLPSRESLQTFGPSRAATRHADADGLPPDVQARVSLRAEGSKPSFDTDKFSAVASAALYFAGANRNPPMKYLHSIRT